MIDHTCTDIAVTYSDDQTDHNLIWDASIAFAMFSAYQYEVDHPEESAAVRGSVVPVKVVMRSPEESLV